MLLSENTFQLLGDSSTFIGTMLTLNVLCIFLNNQNNFLINLLSFQKDKYKDKLSDIVAKTKDRITTFRNSENFKNIQNYADKDDEESKAAQKLLSKIYLQFNSSQIELSEFYVESVKVQNFREQVLAPTYCLVLGLMLFVLDEIGRFYCQPPVWFVYGISILMLFSSIYWITIWLAFFCHGYSTIGDKGESTFRKVVVYIKETKVSIVSFMMIFISALIYLLVLILVPWQKMTPTGRCLVNFAALALPITIAGIVSVVTCDIKGRYSYMHVLGHLGAFTIYSIVSVIIFNVVGTLSVESLEFMADSVVLHTWIWVFLLTVGIVLPFACPSFANSYYYKKEKSKLMAEYNEKETAFIRFEEDVETLYKNIGRNKVNAQRDSRKHDELYQAEVEEYYNISPKPKMAEYCKDKGLDFIRFRSIYKNYNQSKRQNN